MNTKTAMITIAGRPNVGKSTLTNYLVGEKIAIVSNKPQTTRNRICGIVTKGDTQFVFVDTPGYHRSRTKLGDYMVNVARESIADVDLTILVVEPIASIGPQEEGLLEKIKASRCPAVLAINKIDTIEKEKLLEIIAVYSQAAEFDAITVGYLADPLQAEKVSGVLRLFQSTVILDPAMGDHGRLYSGQTPEHVQAMAQLCRQADFLLPNLTEAALLTNLPYREDADTGYLQELADGMLSFGAKAVVITGFTRSDGKTGFFGARKDGSSFTYQAQRIPKHFHGTGDLFAAVFAGAMLQGKDAPEAAALAARFVERVIAATEESSPFGISFEPELPWLWSQF